MVRWRDPEPVARVAGWRKGGRLAWPTRGAEVRDERAPRLVRGAELVGDIAQGAVLTKDATEGLVWAVEGLGGFPEEAEAVGVIHARSSERRVDSRRVAGLMVCLGREGSQG